MDGVTKEVSKFKIIVVLHEFKYTFNFTSVTLDNKEFLIRGCGVIHAEPSKCCKALILELVPNQSLLTPWD